MQFILVFSHLITRIPEKMYVHEKNARRESAYTKDTHVGVSCIFLF